VVDRIIITAIDADPTEPELRFVRAGRQTLGRVRRHLIDELALRVGDAVDDATRSALADAHRLTDLRVKAIRSLSRAAASSARLAARLARGGGDAHEIESVIAELKYEGILSDEDTARRIATDALRKSPVGRAHLAALLLRRGFDETTLERVLNAVLETQDEHRDALRAAERCLRGLHALPREVAARRLSGRLARRGFSEDAIAEAVAACLGESDVDSV